MTQTMPQPNPVPVSTLVRGLEQSLRRYLNYRIATFEKGRHDPLDLVPPLYECLNWIATIDDRLSTEYEPFTDDGRDWPQLVDSFKSGMQAIRFSRNRVQHHWAGAIEIGTGDFSTQPSPQSPSWIDWVWAKELPHFGNDRNRNDCGKREYEAILAGEVVHGSIKSYLD